VLSKVKSWIPTVVAALIVCIALVGAKPPPEGMAPYLRPEMLVEVTELLFDGRAFFDDPAGNESVLNEYGVDYCWLQRKGIFSIASRRCSGGFRSSDAEAGGRGRIWTRRSPISSGALERHPRTVRTTRDPRLAPALPPEGHRRAPRGSNA
jgi:hypothetical protein